MNPRGRADAFWIIGSRQSLERVMIRIADLLDRDFSEPIEEIVKVDNDDPGTVFRELTEYIATNRIKADYERLFSAIAAAVTISGRMASGHNWLG